MTIDTHRKSNAFAVAQTSLIVVFAAVCLFAPGMRLFDALTIAGSAIGVAGLLLMAPAFVSLRKVVQIAPEPKAEGHLVTSGVYRLLRHPMYSGIVLVVAGLFLREPGVFVAISGAVLIAFLITKSRFEEKLLAARYADYAEYRKRTWGVIPGL
ncbi:MAG TPA: isoprenylcysteine carboxylmethyltransferase family protein [Thermoanaerobaculia bacterium]|nr:isoprenylcysteine carboxylmethyltransferase family protein [Thermoanaerobaculia bacterium]